MRRMRCVLLLALAISACGREPPPAPAAAPAPAATPEPSPPPAAPARAAARAEPDWGEPDLAKIQRLFRQRFPEVKRCYEAALAQDEGASGRFTLRFTILTSGALDEVSAARSTFRRRDVPACVAEVVRRWRTPFRPAEPVAVEYPFRFTPR